MRTSHLFSVAGLVLAAGCSLETSQTTNALNSLGEDTPVAFRAPAAGFSSTGSQTFVVWVAKGYYEQSILDPNGGPHGPGDVVLIASAEGCSTTASASIRSAGTVAPEATNPHGQAIKGYLWTVTLDLSACASSGTRTHHCDGCGRSFDTCEGGGGSSAVTAVVDAYNQPNNSMCTLHDFNTDGLTDCDVVTGTLGGGLVEQWVPAKFWTDNNTVCVRRAAPDGSCHPVGGEQGGHSCD